MYTIKAQCTNCSLFYTEKTEHKIEVEVVASLGGTCKACRGVASNFYASNDYKLFEDSEKDYRF